MKLNRKLKKRIIKTFGKGTYIGIIQGYIKFKKYHKFRGVETIYTSKKLDKPLMVHQYNPFLGFKNIY